MFHGRTDEGKRIQNNEIVNNPSTYDTRDKLNDDEFYGGDSYFMPTKK